MIGMYEITINSSKYQNLSGVYYGDLKEILPRLSEGIDSTQNICVKKIKIKTIDLDMPKRSVGFFTYDKELKDMLDFCHQSLEDYFVYVPNDIVKPFCFQGRKININDELCFSEEGEMLCGKVAWFDYDNDLIKVICKGYMHNVKVDSIYQHFVLLG